MQKLEKTAEYKPESTLLIEIADRKEFSEILESFMIFFPIYLPTFLTKDKGIIYVLIHACVFWIQEARYAANILCLLYLTLLATVYLPVNTNNLKLSLAIAKNCYFFVFVLKYYHETSGNCNMR